MHLKFSRIETRDFGSMSNLQCQNSDLAATMSPWRSNFCAEEPQLVPRSPSQKIEKEKRKQEETLT